MSILISRQKEAEIISDILLRAASEPEFRNLLIKNPGDKQKNIIFQMKPNILSRKALLI